MSAAKQRLALVSIAASSVASAAIVIIAITPQFKEGTGTDVMMTAPELHAIGRAIAFVLGIALAGAGVWVFTSQLSEEARRRARRVTAFSILFGMALGFGFRIVTAKTEGANIGGGLIVLAFPVLALAYLAYLVSEATGWQDQNADSA